VLEQVGEPGPVWVLISGSHAVPEADGHHWGDGVRGDDYAQPVVERRLFDWEGGGALAVGRGDGHNRILKGDD
jgi:hypothetical protein